MKTVLITGGIASGKSALCRMLEERGYPVYDSDSRARGLYESVPGLKARVEAAAGVPLGRLAGVIFNDPAAREAVEAIVYPEVLRDFETWRDCAEADVVFMESAVAGDRELFRALFDKVVLVRAPMQTRLARGGDKVEQRAGSQSFEGIKADWVIDNGGTLDELATECEILLKKIKDEN